MHVVLNRFSALLLLCIFSLAAADAKAQLEPQPTDFGDDQTKELAKRTLATPPQLLTSVDIPFPVAAQKEQRGGELVARITIDSNGKVSRVDITTSTTHEDLDWAALGALTQFTFKPAIFSDGLPGPVAIDYRTVFEITEITEEVDIDEDGNIVQDDGIVSDEDQQALQNDPLAKYRIAGAGAMNLEGIVRESATKAELDGVEVTVTFNDPITNDKVILDLLSDDEGRFYVYNLPPGPVRLAFGATSYLPAFVDEEINPKKRTQVIVYLRPEQANAFETVVRAKRAKKEVSKISLTREEVRRIPGTFGDPIRVIQNLPGLARAPGASGQLIVRGANPQDTGTYFDGVEIPLLYHFGGLTSVVNAEFLEDINFYPGGFGPYYGRATAGIVDVSSRRLNFNKYRGYAEVDLFDSGFFFGGPLQIGQLPTFNFAVAARRSYIDALLPIALDIFVGPGGQGIVASPIYWDYQAKLEVSPFAGNNFSLFVFGSDDDLKVTATGLGNADFSLGFKTSFHRAIARWDLRLPGGISHRLQPFFGIEVGAIDAASSTGVGAAIDIVGTSWGLRDELRWKPSETFEIATGVDYQGSTFGLDFDIPISPEVGSFPRVIPRLTENSSFSTSGVNNELAVYTEAILEPVKGWQVIPGVRAELALITLNDEERPDGSISEGANVNLWNVDPRITSRLTLLPGSTLKGAFGVYRQLPEGNQVSEEAGNPKLFMPRALHFIGGIEQKLTKSINLDVQGYYINRDLFVQSTNDVINKGDGSVEPIFFNNGGRGRTYGVEFLLRHELNKYFFGWVAYTLSRSEIDLNENSDTFRLTNFDQTHILTVVAQANLPWAITFGGRFRLVSGSPTNLPLGSVHDLDTDNYSRRGSAGSATRLPTFHQLDLRIDKKWQFDTFSFTTYLDLLNAYNRSNAENFQEDYRNREVEPINGLPILPVIGLSGEF